MADSEWKPEDAGDGIVTGNSGWTFELQPELFENHIEKSAPFYRAGHDLIARISDFFLPEGAVVYDIGTTTGAVARAILERHPRASALR